MPAYSCASSGISGLDDVLAGGLPRDRIYLVQGDPGVGKTTVVQFLLDGVARGERCLYITLSETQAEIRAVVDSHGWTLDGLEVVELSALDQSSALEADNTLFEPSEVELHETTRTLLSHVERVKPTRVVFDSLSELRLLAQSPLRYRRQILGLKQYFADKQSTVMLLDDRTSQPTDLQLQSLAHGVLHLEQVPPVYGDDRRRLRVLKLRGVKFRGGYHDFTIRTGGVVVFPRLVAAEHHVEFERSCLSSGLARLDALLGGGLDRGTATLITGPAGSGKSAVAIQYAVAAVARGDHAAILAFDERITTMKDRSRALGQPIDEYHRAGKLGIEQIDPAELSPGELTDCVRQYVEERGTKLIVIDSLNGYLNAMPEEKFLSLQLHELLSYLAHRGVTTVLVMAQHGLLGTAMQSPIDVSYVADTVMLLRYFEAEGKIRKAVSVVKKRSGAHENVIRELTLDKGGIHVGEPLAEFRGVLTGIPMFTGKAGDLAR
jgi:circadian clock protein KaiC